MAMRIFFIAVLGLWSFVVQAAGGHKAVAVDETMAPAAPSHQMAAQGELKSAGCRDCHTDSDQSTMHSNPAVVLGCTDCHGGNAASSNLTNLDRDSDSYQAAMRKAHVLPRYPEDWHYPSSANPERSYTLLNRESPAFIRFVNPGDYRIADEACGACHAPIIEAAKRSLMSTGAMLWGGATYNNGILPFKRYKLGESYTMDGVAARITAPIKLDENMLAKGLLPELWPLPAWEATPPGDIFRVFERGGRNILNIFPEVGLPGSVGQIQRLEEPGRPDIRQSNRGPGTGSRVAIPSLNIHKTRLNDPLSWFMGTNDQPGDYRSSGCSGCHVVYANDRDPRHSAGYAAAGHKGQSLTVDPTINHEESGHPIRHAFTRAIPTSQCMTCHMHQPNVFVNSFMGYTMWDYESDAPSMWPEEQQYPTAAEKRAINDRNPEAAAARGLWGDLDFLAGVSERNDQLKDTQFADYHGHGWNFRAVQKRDKTGQLLDAKGDVVAHDDPEKFDKAVHLSSIHLDAGMHCVDCHFSQDAHGNGHIYGEVAQAIEIECQDCHGSADAYPNLRSSGPAAEPGGRDLAAVRLGDGRPRFEWKKGALYQNSSLDPKLRWKVSLVRDSVNKKHADYNPKAARAKLMSSNTASQSWGKQLKPEQRAHKDEEMMCATCHTSWMTSCFGCHLPIEANWKTERKHYEGGETRNFATYNPQVVRDDVFMLGKHGGAKGYRIAPVRSSSALLLSSTNANRERIYTQQPPIAASGYSSQAFAPHFAHTVRKTETKQCSDCHLSESGDNNAWMAQLLTQGTNFVNFVGLHAYMGTSAGVSAVQVTEWEEPQAVIGSYLHKYAYPDWFEQHQQREQALPVAHHASAPEAVTCLQLRGEYLYTAQGRGGIQVYDVANIANKGYSQRIQTGPFSRLGHDTRVELPAATCIALPTNQSIAPDRNQGELMREVNQEQPFHPIYHYAVASDLEKGLVLIDVDTLADGEPRNNQLHADVQFNPDGALDGARYLTLAGHYAYVLTADAVVVVNLDAPSDPKITARLELRDPRSIAIQFRYAFVTTANGLEVLDVTQLGQPKALAGSTLPMKDARSVYLARTYAYVAAGEEGLVIVNVQRPAEPKVLTAFNPQNRLAGAADVIVGSTNASAFAYVATASGLQVVQLTSPDSQPGFYGFSPEPVPQWIAHFATDKPALTLAKGLDRDRGVDESGHQIAVFGRLGSRPFKLDEMQKLYLDESGQPWVVKDE